MSAKNGHQRNNKNKIASIFQYPINLEITEVTVDFQTNIYTANCCICSLYTCWCYILFVPVHRVITVLSNCREVAACLEALLQIQNLGTFFFEGIKCTVFNI